MAVVDVVVVQDVLLECGTGDIFALKLCAYDGLPISYNFCKTHFWICRMLSCTQSATLTTFSGLRCVVLLTSAVDYTCVGHVGGPLIFPCCTSLNKPRT
jgi:hypothetical protein